MNKKPTTTTTKTPRRNQTTIDRHIGKIKTLNKQLSEIQKKKIDLEMKALEAHERMITQEVELMEKKIERHLAKRDKK